MNKNILCIIPARKGSKRVKNKNFRLLGKKPLINYTFDFANLLIAQLKNVNLKVICTTDSDKAKKILSKKKYKNIFYYQRSKKLSNDKALTYDVVTDVINKSNENFEYILLLQPTCPFRRVNDIKKSLNLLTKNFESVVSISSVGSYHPFRMKKYNKNNRNLENFIDQGFEDMRPIQKIMPLYIRSGSIYLTKIDSLKKNKSLVGSKCKGILLTSKYAINIDDKYDFQYAQTFI